VQRAPHQLRRLPEGTLRLLNPHTYRVSLAAPLQASRDALIAALQGQDVPAPIPGPDGTPGT